MSLLEKSKYNNNVEHELGIYYLQVKKVYSGSEKHTRIATKVY
jgi:hypothetical protein